GAPVEVVEGGNGAADDHRDVDTIGLDELGQIDDQLSERRQVRAESLEQAFELRDHEDQQNAGDDDCNDEHGRWVEKSLLDLLLQRLVLYFVGCALIEQRFERTRLLTGLDEIDEQVIELQGVLGERLVQGSTAFDVCLDVQNQLLHRRLVVTV